MDKVQKHNSFNTNTPPSESYKNNLYDTHKSIIHDGHVLTSNEEKTSKYQRPPADSVQAKSIATITG
jgi:hypothetical protein